ncbi:relaxase/mobilization nuclease domain-containing protein [Mesorhizobium sp. IMUNJ 23232]|uniref:relaxase/mobilization nuclease domain-containing protein n=1 Tax=Mesorhizobium sp. IMUNJ 23232 TaxID=3376064 RepID=UPI0037A25BF9
MTKDDDFRVRPGRMRSRSAERVRPFILQALAAAQRAGGHISHTGKITSGRGGGVGRGRVATIRANRLITRRTRFCTVKARVVRQNGKSAPLSRHLGYLRREGVTRDGENALMFGAKTDDIDLKAFTERCEDDRHHFRFIVSPEDAFEMADLKTFARDLMAQAGHDLGTKLDWVAADHWNTDNPHVHIIVRGRTDDGKDLVIDRDYIRRGMRDRAQDLVTQELGPRNDQEIRRMLDRQIEAERWTQLDRQLQNDADRHGVIDIAPAPDKPPDEYLTLKVGRLRKLESLGLATEIGPGQWIIAEEAEPTLRALGERGDIIKRIHRSLAEHGLDRGPASYVLSAEEVDTPVIGRLLERGLHDELSGSAYAIIDSIDGRTQHIRFHNLEATADSPPGSIVELRRYEDAKGHDRVVLAVRSDLSVAEQVHADGATWLDRQFVAREPAELGEGGFGREVKEALEARAEHLIKEGLASRTGQRTVVARNLIGTLRDREIEVLGERLANETGLPFTKSADGGKVSGIYTRRLSLASGRFAMIDDGLGFQLVPWSPSMEKHIDRHVSGVVRAGGGIDWHLGRKRGLAL